MPILFINLGVKIQNNMKQSWFIAGWKVNIGTREDEGIKIKEEYIIGICKENVDPNIALTDSSSNAPMKVAKPKRIDAYIKMETLTDSICTIQKRILPSKVWEQ
eukprot:11137163-Ditylum_brightwellii.AAC.1